MPRLGRNWASSAHLAVLAVGFAWLFVRTDLSLANGALSFAGLLPGAIAKSAVAALILRPLLSSRRPA